MTLMGWLRTQAADEDRILVMGDDGEKFGLWPGTKALCWDRGWVENFLHRARARAGLARRDAAR